MVLGRAVIIPVSSLLLNTADGGTALRYACSVLYCLSVSRRLALGGTETIEVAERTGLATMWINEIKAKILANFCLNIYQ